MVEPIRGENQETTTDRAGPSDRTRARRRSEELRPLAEAVEELRLSNKAIVEAVRELAEAVKELQLINKAWEDSNRALKEDVALTRSRSDSIASVLHARGLLDNGIGRRRDAGSDDAREMAPERVGDGGN